MTVVLMGLPFFRSFSQGWLSYYKKSSGPKFIEEQIRMADHTAGKLRDDFLVDDFIDPITHSENLEEYKL